MKRITSMIFAVLMTAGLQTQAQIAKNVVVEHFTNTRCSICASRNPGFYDNLDNYPGVIHIAYHPSSPYSSCVLNKQNVAGNDGRTKFYGVYGGTPRLVIQGKVISSGADYGSSSLFTSEQGKVSGLKLELVPDKSNSGKLQAELNITTVGSNMPDSARVFVVAVEDTVFYNAPNGENQHYDVYRKTLMDKIMELPNMAGGPVSIPLSVDFDNAWDKGRMYLVAIVQDKNTKEVLQVVSDEEIRGQTASIRRIGGEEFRLYPNPATDYIIIQREQAVPFDYKIINLLGSLVTYGRSSGRIDISSLKPGVYFVQVSTVQGDVTIRWVKE